MKILFTLTYYFPYISGLTVHGRRLAEALSLKRFDVSVLTTQFSKDLPLIDRKNGVQVLRVPFFLKLHKGFIMPDYLVDAWRAVNKSDIAVSHLPQVESIIIALYSFILRKRFYVIYHCEVILPDNLLNNLIQIILKIIHFFVLLLAGNVITYTEDYASNNALLRFFNKKVIYIYPPVPQPEIDKQLYLKIKKNIPGDKKYIIGVAARISREKGIESLLYAVPYLEKSLGSDFMIVFAGSEHPVGEEEYWNYMQPLFKKYKKHLAFIGEIQEESMGTFYKLLDILILPSVNPTEAFGMVQVEAMLCGVPVVASNLPGVRIPVVETGMGEIFKPNDSRDLAEKIIKVIKARNTYVKNSNFISNKFSLRDTITRYEKLFK